MLDIYIQQEETDQWFYHHSKNLPKFSDEQMQVVKYLSGKVPLLLRPLLGLKEFKESAYIKCKVLWSVNLAVDAFYRTKRRSLLNDDLSLDL
jgi:hypothetical protein